MSNYTKKLNLKGINQEDLKLIKIWFIKRFPEGNLNEFLKKMGVLK